MKTFCWRLMMCLKFLSMVISSWPTKRLRNTRGRRCTYIGESVDNLETMVWMTSASPHFASPSEAIQTVQYVALFLLFCLLHASRIVLTTRACSSLVSLFQVPENMIGQTAYSRGSDESMLIAATVACRCRSTFTVRYENYIEYETHTSVARCTLSFSMASQRRPSSFSEINSNGIQ